MGFDLYGAKPIERTEKPEMLEQNWQDISEDDREEYWKINSDYEKSNPGVYFRNNVWYWRPLWAYVCQVCYEVMSEDDMEAGTHNGGVKISMKKARKMYKILETLIDAGEVQKEEERYRKSLEDMPLETCSVCDGSGKKRPGDSDPKRKKCWKCEGTGEQENWMTSYPFIEKNVVEFSHFLRDCGGFRIC